MKLNVGTRFKKYGFMMGLIILASNARATEYTNKDQLFAAISPANFAADENIIQCNHSKPVSVSKTSTVVPKILAEAMGYRTLISRGLIFDYERGCLHNGTHYPRAEDQTIKDALAAWNEATKNWCTKELRKVVGSLSCEPEMLCPGSGTKVACEKSPRTLDLVSCSDASPAAAARTDKTNISFTTEDSGNPNQVYAICKHQLVIDTYPTSSGNVNVICSGCAAN